VEMVHANQSVTQTIIVTVTRDLQVMTVPIPVMGIVLVQEACIHMDVPLLSQELCLISVDQQEGAITLRILIMMVALSVNTK